MEIEDHQYLMFNSTATNNSGILFYEVYGKYATSVQYGAFIEYAEMTSFNSLIKVQDSGELIIDGGKLKNGTVLIEDGGKLTIMNGGDIQLSEYDNFNMQLGGILDLTSGSIIFDD